MSIEPNLKKNIIDHERNKNEIETTINEYLTNVKIKSIEDEDKIKEELTKNFLERRGIFGTKIEADIYIIKKAITQELNKNNNCIKKGWFPKSDNSWIRCTDKCRNQIKPILDEELESTAFMLRLLSESVIYYEKNSNENPDIEAKLQFELNGYSNNLSGKWAQDSEYFNLVYEPNKECRLIMGLGPSASGKTHWAQEIINLLCDSDPEKKFPRAFLSIDGGLAREFSYSYQAIIKAFKGSKCEGFDNLKCSGLWSGFGSGKRICYSLFDSTNVKKNIMKYLSQQKKLNGKLPISIYSPETLGGFKTYLQTNKFQKTIKKDIESMKKKQMLYAVPLKGGYTPCSKIQDLVALTGDNNYICLYIWQGKDKDTEKKWVDKFKDTSYFKSYKEEHLNEYIDIEAIPTKDAGEFREVKEGKKYSSKLYEASEIDGRFCLHQAPIKIEIHNSGMPESKSVIFEWPHEDKKDGQFKYVLNEHTVKDKNAIYVKLNQLSILKEESAAGRKRKSRKKSKKKTKANKPKIKKSRKKSRKKSKKGRNGKK